MEKISADKQYKYITGHLQYLNEKIIQSFTLFIKLAMAIIAGTFTLYWKLVDKAVSFMLGPLSFIFPFRLLWPLASLYGSLWYIGLKSGKANRS